VSALFVKQLLVVQTNIGVQTLYFSLRNLELQFEMAGLPPRGHEQPVALQVGGAVQALQLRLELEVCLAQEHELVLERDLPYKVLLEGVLL
jgi:hypothetical protein